MNISEEINGPTYDECIAEGICPECGAELVFINGCKQCYECGWSACGN